MGNRILADYALTLNPQVSIVPTVVDCEKYTFPPARRNRAVTIGWIGSHSTAPYLRAIEPALGKIAEACPGKVKFRFYGFPDYRPNLPNSESVPFRLNSEIADLQSLDIGLMPLPDTEWGRGKCAFKAIQYMASGVATVASPVGITPDLIEHNMNGLLADSEEDWFQALKVLIDEPDVRTRIAQAARRTIEASYSLRVWGPRVAALFEMLLGCESTRPSQQVVAAISGRVG